MTTSTDATQALDLAIFALSVLAHPEGSTTQEAWDLLDAQAPQALRTLTALRDAVTTHDDDPRPTAGTIYGAWDRWVCSEIPCAGMTATATGVTIGGYRLHPIAAEDVREVTALTGQRHIACDCGRLRASLDAHGRLVTTDTRTTR